RTVPQRHAVEVRCRHRTGPAERGHRHRRPGDRKGDGDRAAQPFRAASRRARRYPGPCALIPMSDLFSLPFEEDRKTPAVPAAPQRRVLTVSELTATIRGLLETSFGDVWVEGEISNCRPWNTGHVYFTLKDGGAQIKAVMFRSAVRYLRFKPEDGLRVIARGRLGVYEPKGEYQIVCEHLEPHGLGALQLAFEQLKKRLQAEGLFDAARKRPLPSLPRKIGIVTSLDGAALRDIIKVLGRR